jgi:hypothetical protein
VTRARWLVVAAAVLALAAVSIRVPVHTKEDREWVHYRIGADYANAAIDHHLGRIVAGPLISPGPCLPGAPGMSQTGSIFESTYDMTN